MPVLGPGWSLRHELLFYAFFSTALISRRLGMAALGIWFFGTVASLVLQLQSGEPLFGGLTGDLLFRGFNIEFFFGIATAFLVLRRQFRFPVIIVLLGAATFLVTGTFEAFGPARMHEWPIRHLAYGMSAAAVLYGVALLDRSGRRYVPRFAVRLGTASYSIYLVHIPVLLIGEFALRGIHRSIPVEVAFCALTAFAASCGIVFSEWVEQPLLRYGRSVAGGPRWLTGPVLNLRAGTAQPVPAGPPAT